ncbi:hybrid sensor histidine kinase/response regulator transcription factor [Flavobacterium foetidum]|uniref:hybrid sensor histidine kinase/response regulator transcription factor n=1 Tax=Flavobacterium foetidum TaxID=2026681 RepID=UPI0013C2C3A6|nr:hybrid sensor histidine kinase/response regulator transcription factor [Flavobacterium foetidum]KAF2508322.1 response regulator [Flavobacterium foetidum]
MAQPKGILTHLSNDGKLTQSRVLGIQQDKKGFIWLATFNGLIRYDGNSFRKFKVKQDLTLDIQSNRVSKFKFDTNGRIWIQSEKNDIYYFDTNELKFYNPAKKTSDIAFTEFKIMPSGRTWLFPKDKSCIMVFETDKKIETIKFDNVKNCGKIRDVYEDNLGTTWFLTESGICRLNKSGNIPEYFFTNMRGLSGRLYSYNVAAETKEDLWFAGDNGKFTRYTKKSRTFFDLDLGIKEDILLLNTINDNKFLVITKKGGFGIYDIITAKLDYYTNKTLAGMPTESINFLGLTGSRYFWFDNLSGLFQFDVLTRQLKRIPTDASEPALTGGKQKSFLLTAPNGTVWIQSNKGAFGYWDEKQGKLCSVMRCIKESKETLSDVMYTAMVDKLGNLWFCSYKQGLDLITFSNRNFLTLDIRTSTDNKKHNVRSLMTDNKGNLWVASRDEKIEIFNPQKKKIGFLGSNGMLSDGGSAWGADIYSMMQDAQGRIWIGTRGNGVFCLSPKQNPFDFTVQHFKYNQNDKYSISSDDVYKIFQASDGNIYLGTWGGGINMIRFSNDNIHFISYRNELKNYPIGSADKVRSIVETKDHRLFFVSSYKLLGISQKNKTPDKIHFKEYYHASGNDILDVIVTSGNQIALATNGKGLILVEIDKQNYVKSKSFWNENFAFPLEGVVGMQEDYFGKIWLMGDNQLARFDPKNNSCETFPELKSIIGTEIFSEATKCRLQNGEVALGYSDGLIYFKPEAIKPFAFKPYLAVSGFLVNNKELFEVNPETPKNPDMLKEVTLQHDQNFFRIQFSALDFIKNENIVYRYKLKGIDKEWNYLKAGQSINYTNLGRGDYTLLVSSTNGHNLWLNNEREIKITIRPSVWGTYFAYCCYLVLACGLFFLTRRTILTILKLRHDVRVQKEMSELKLNFFTDISHEIRTPLTMITAPLEVMLSDNRIEESVKSQLRTIEKYSNKLLNLVNQILDLRRMQDKKLEVRKIDLRKFVTDVSKSFKDVSLRRHIQLKISSSGEDLQIWADPDSLDKILVNLLSNAFKYCKKGSLIEVQIEESDTNVSIKVKDNGPGISPTIQKKLFVRFSNYNENPFNPSTGIGLSIVKDSVDKHGASISVETKEGKGTTFKVCFLKGTEHFSDDVVLFQETAEVLDEDENGTSVFEENGEKIREKPIGLVVEDDPELRAFIVSVLKEDYNVFTAVNGEEGHLKTVELIPDFVISDIMMPEMDGIEMLKVIRSNFDVSHIPVILLSAKTAIESKLEGLEYGADDYITKPFNVSFLKARVKNVLEQRFRLQQLYSTGSIAEITAEKSLQISNKDNKFMLQVIDLVKANISKSDFSVDELGKLMCMSRASFFNKLKHISGVSPVVFIRDMRLAEAAELLKNEDLLIKEVCFEVGFSDLKYFSKCFRAKYDYTPAEYRRKFR